MAKMDIKGILANQWAELLDVDLATLEEELATGDYDSSYVLECNDAIWRIRRERTDAFRKDLLAKKEPVEGSKDFRALEPSAAMPKAKIVKEPGKKPELSVNVPLSESVMAVPTSELSPYGTPAAQPEPTEGEKLMRQLELIRQAAKPLAELGKYLMGSPFDEAFIERNISVFRGAELSVVLGCYGFDEDFLEKYFNIFDADDTAKTQRFSEEFFMRHYAELDAQTVLEQGVNGWRKKGARSKKLDMFLRLKGVHL